MLSTSLRIRRTPQEVTEIFFYRVALTTGRYNSSLSLTTKNIPPRADTARGNINALVWCGYMVLPFKFRAHYLLTFEDEETAFLWFPPFYILNVTE